MFVRKRSAQYRAKGTETDEYRVDVDARQLIVPEHCECLISSTNRSARVLAVRLQLSASSD